MKNKNICFSQVIHCSTKLDKPLKYLFSYLSYRFIQVWKISGIFHWLHMDQTLLLNIMNKSLVQQLIVTLGILECFLSGNVDSAYLVTIVATHFSSWCWVDTKICLGLYRDWTRSLLYTRRELEPRTLISIIRKHKTNCLFQFHFIMFYINTWILYNNKNNSFLIYNR